MKKQKAFINHPQFNEKKKKRLIPTSAKSQIVQFYLCYSNKLIKAFTLCTFHIEDEPREGFHYLDDARVSEGLVQDVHLTAELQSVDDEVLLPGGDLHQAGDAQEAPVGVVLQRASGRQSPATLKSAAASLTFKSRTSRSTANSDNRHSFSFRATRSSRVVMNEHLVSSTGL